MNSALETFVPLQFKRKKGKLLVDGRESAHDVRIIEAVARAMFWHDLLDTGAFKSVVDIAKAEGLMPTTVGRMLRLARLAPDLVEQLMQGCQPRRLTLLWLMRNDIPALWPDQRQMLERFRQEAE
jgi:ParB-like chromosome segregation protein Spo0J